MIGDYLLTNLIMIFVGLGFGLVIGWNLKDWQNIVTFAA